MLPGFPFGLQPTSQELLTGGLMDLIEIEAENECLLASLPSAFTMGWCK